jgi:hypothetical protein
MVGPLHTSALLFISAGTVVVVILWIYNNESVPITTNVVSSNPAHGEVYSIQH